MPVRNLGKKAMGYRWACGMDPDYIPPGPVSIDGILSDIIDSDEDPVELVQSARFS